MASNEVRHVEAPRRSVWSRETPRGRRGMSRRPAVPPAEEARGRTGGIGRSSSPAAEAVSDALRRQSSPFLNARRRIVALDLVATGALSVVAAYQTGLLRHIPDPPGRWFNSDKVDASGEAYKIGLVPDALLGMASAVATAALATAGAQDRHRHHPWLPLVLFGKVTTDTAWAIRLTAEQISKHRALCFWCVTAAAAQVLTLPQALPEALAALSKLRH